MDIGDQRVQQWVSLADSDKRLWHDLCGAYGNYGHYITKHGDWTLWLTISKHGLRNTVRPDSEGRLDIPLGADIEQWKTLMAIECHEYIFIYEDPDLRKKSQKKKRTSI